MSGLRRTGSPQEHDVDGLEVQPAATAPRILQLNVARSSARNCGAPPSPAMWCIRSAKHLVRLGQQSKTAVRPPRNPFESQGFSGDWPAVRPVPQPEHRDLRDRSGATEIKVRAERRCGELLRTNLATPAERGERGAEVRWGSRSNDATSQPPTLADMGLTRDESSRYQQLAAMPAEHFETAVATAKATAGEVMRAARRLAGPNPILDSASGALLQIEQCAPLLPTAQEPGGHAWQPRVDQATGIGAAGLKSAGAPGSSSDPGDRSKKTHPASGLERTCGPRFAQIAAVPAPVMPL